MVRYVSIGFVTLVFVLLAGLTGCAKTPAVSAPATSGSPQVVAASSDVGGRSADGAMASATDGAMTSRADGVPTGRPAPGSFVSLPELGDIHFDFDKYDIRPGDARILEANAKWLKTNPEHLVLIEGHCDERGTNEYNLVLGDRRAKATLNYLLAHGVAANRIHIISYGEERPVCSEKNQVCWSKNRRAHFGVKPL